MQEQSHGMNAETVSAPSGPALRTHHWFARGNRRDRDRCVAQPVSLAGAFVPSLRPELNPSPARMVFYVETCG